MLDVSFVGGFARAGGVTVDEYLEASVDRCLAFSSGHGPHERRPRVVKQYVEVLVGCAPVKSARMKRLDRVGFDVRVEDAESGSTGVLRVPFDEEVTERKKIKDAIVALSKKCAEINPDWRPHGSEEE